ncbi:MAG TPA: hypothetical protein VGR43_05185 [Dehalococcoidia bacterium]|nr:hypothetical protein [Dehalococcoidia bacterium]
MILLLTGVITLLTTTGCLVSEGGRHGHNDGYRYHHRSAVIVGPPVVVVRPPEIIIR